MTNRTTLAQGMMADADSDLDALCSWSDQIGVRGHSSSYNDSGIILLL